MANLHKPRLGVALVAVAAAAPTSVAARTVFDPQLEVGIRATDNTLYQEPGSNDTSDTIAVLAATLSLAGDSPRSEWSFRYRPEVQRYQDFDLLDHDEHRADLDWSTSLGHRSRFGTEANYMLTQGQGVPQEIGDPNWFVTERTDRQWGRLRFVLDHEQSRVWSWNAAVEGQAYRYEAIEGLSDPVGTTIEDRNEFGITYGLVRQHSPKTEVGGRLEWRHFDLETSGEEQTISLTAIWNYLLGPSLKVTTETGVFWLSGEAGTDQDSRWGLRAVVEVEREWADRRLRMRLDNGPSSGEALAGSAIDSALSASYGSDEVHTWNWEVAPYAARRTTTDDAPPSATGGGGQDTIYGWGARAGVGRMLGEHVGLNLSLDHFDQSDEESISTAELRVTWSPLRRTDRPDEEP